MVRALIFDFDGLILDTETSVYESWRRVYEEQGVVLPRDRWCEAIGGSGREFDPLQNLLDQTDGRVVVEALQTRRRGIRDALLVRESVLPGVEGRLAEARGLDLGVGIASSSPRSWVEAHLRRLDLFEHFDRIVTEDDVSQVKPDPELYLCAVRVLGVEPAEAVAIEDSPNGVAAAKAAGLACIAVPGPMTRGLAFDAADLMLESLEARTLPEILETLAT